MNLEQGHYAVIFTSERTAGDQGYEAMATQMLTLATGQEGFLGVESARDSALGITVSYWRSLASIKKWKENAAHQLAQKQGRDLWYQSFSVKICRIEKEYCFKKEK